MMDKMKILLLLNGINSGWFVKKSYVDNEGIEGETLAVALLFVSEISLSKLWSHVDTSMTDILIFR